MHTIRSDKVDGLWTVGYANGSVWTPLQDFAEFSEAAEFCSWLNGGLSPSLTEKIFDSLKIGGALNKPIERWP